MHAEFPAVYQEGEGHLALTEASYEMHAEFPAVYQEGEGHLALTEARYEILRNKTCENLN